MALTRFLPRRRRPGVPHLRATDHPVGRAFAIALGVFGLVVLFWQAGLLQTPEFHVYDQYIRWRAVRNVGEQRVAVIEITEDDIGDLHTYPLDDAKLLELLLWVSQCRPAAVAIDLFRDKVYADDPQPGVRTSSARLREFFEQTSNVIGIERVGYGGLPPVRAPAGLPPDQIGFNDFPVDDQVDGTARRVALLTDLRGELHFAMSLLASLLYLQTRGVELEQNPARPELWTLGKLHLQPLKSNAGAYVGADMQGLQLILDFKKHRGSEKRTNTSELIFSNAAGPAGREPRKFSLQEVLGGKVSAAQFAGKVVLIGTTAESQKDFLRTPLGERYNGVMLHAQGVDQVLRLALDGDRLTRAWPEWGEAVWVLAWTLVGVTLGVLLRSPLTLVIAGATALLALVATTGLAFRYDWWLLTVAPASGFTASAGLTVAYVSQREWRQRMLLMRLFGQHVSHEIAQQVWENRADFHLGAGLRPLKLTATVFFTDLRGFTPISEAMDPESLMTWLNEYMNMLTVLVAEHQGVLCKFTGDGLMAVFGVPIPRESRAEIEQDATNAVCCAMAITRRLAEMNQEWEAQGRPSARMRIGIHTSPLVAGSLGGGERLEYTVLGDGVNIASRLESTPDSDPDAAGALVRILVSEQTHELLDGRFESRHVGALSLKGKKEKVIVYLIPDHTIKTLPCTE